MTNQKPKVSHQKGTVFVELKVGTKSEIILVGGGGTMPAKRRVLEMLIMKQSTAAVASNENHLEALEAAWLQKAMAS
jgi:hypothetical protein